MGRLNWNWVPKFLEGQTIKQVARASSTGATLVFESGEQFKIELWPDGIVCTPLDKGGDVIQQ